jgi:hypothetical protein
MDLNLDASGFSHGNDCFRGETNESYEYTDLDLFDLRNAGYICTIQIHVDWGHFDMGGHNSIPTIENEELWSKRE